MLEEQDLKVPAELHLAGGTEGVWRGVAHLTWPLQLPPAASQGWEGRWHQHVASAWTAAGSASLQPVPSSILPGKLQGRVVLVLPHLGPVLLAKAPAPCLTCATLMCSIL